MRRAIASVAVPALCLLALAGTLAGCSESAERPAEEAELPERAEPDAGEREGRAARGEAAVELPPVRPRAIDHGPRGRRLVALTFDADMTPATYAEARAGGPDSYEREIVRKLRRWNVPATIFLTGLWAEVHPDAVRFFGRSELFEVASHSHDHAAWTADCYGLPAISSRREKRRQVTRPARIIEQLTGRPPHWFRFPGLCHEPADLRLVASLGQQVVDGDVHSGDPFNPDPDAVASTVREQTRPGSIVVMHLNGAPNAPATSEALDAIVPELRARNYRFATLTDLLRAR